MAVAEAGRRGRAGGDWGREGGWGELASVLLRVRARRPLPSPRVIVLNITPPLRAKKILFTHRGDKPVLPVCARWSAPCH